MGQGNCRFCPSAIQRFRVEEFSAWNSEPRRNLHGAELLWPNSIPKPETAGADMRVLARRTGNHGNRMRRYAGAAPGGTRASVAGNISTVRVADVRHGARILLDGRSVSRA